MPDAHEIIAAKRAEIEARERALELDKAELAGMEKMVHFFGSLPRGLTATVRTAGPARAFAGGGEARTSGGRQPGAISQRWRRVLEMAILTEGDWVSPDRYVPIIKRLEDRDTTAAQVRRILDGYAEHGFIEVNSQGRYRVSDKAREKFGLAEPSAFDALNGNGEASAEPEDRDEGAPTPSHPHFNP